MTFENLNQFVELLRAIQIKDDNDIFLGVTGRKGSGKSSLSIQIARRYVERYFGEKTFDLKKYIAYNNEDIMEKIHTLPKYSPLIGDEAVRFAWSREWNKSENKELAKLATQIRTKKLIFFMNIPKLAWIDSVYREGMLDIWIWVHATFTETGKESHAILFEPDDNQGEGDSWHMNLLRKYTKNKKNRIGRFTDIQRVYKMVNNHPCFVDTFMFPKLPEDLYQRYLAVRNERAFEKANQYISQKDTAKVMAYNIKERWNKFLEAVKSSKLERPTNKLISDILLHDPTRNQIVVTEGTLRGWLAELKKMLPEVKEEQKTITKKPEEVPEIVKSAMELKDNRTEKVEEKQNESQRN